MFLRFDNIAYAYMQISLKNGFPKDIAYFCRMI